jgi:hypothetical protein
MATIATLEPAILSVEPGAPGGLAVRVRNTGSTVERFDLAIVGPLTQWSSVEPASLSLFPGQEDSARVVFAPPRASHPNAGTYPYGVRVIPAANPGGAVVEEGRVTIGPFTEAAATVVPATSRGSRGGRHEIGVQNRGNAPMDVAVSATDPDRLITFAVQPDRAQIGPGEQAAMALRATPKDTFFLGSKRSQPFDIEVRPGSAPPIALRATLLQGPILPAWLLPVGGILALAIVALVAIPLLMGRGTPPSTATASEAPSPTVEPSPSASEAEPSVSIEPSAAVESSSPSPSPTPGPFELAVIDEGAAPFGGALRLRCAPNDQTCRDNARDTAALFISGMTVRYDGYGIANPRNTNVPNTLPVRLTRDQPFTWQADAGMTGTSDIMVVDLAPLLAQPAAYAYAVVDRGDGVAARFVLPRDTAQQLFDTLYEPAPDVALPTFALPIRPDIGVEWVWNNADYSHLFTKFSPAP